MTVINGKGRKDRIVPLIPTIAKELHSFIRGMKLNEKIFKLNPTSLGMKIKDLAKRAGLDDFHCHSLRHKYATDLLERGVNLKIVQELLGHENIATTEVYLSIADNSLREAVNTLEKSTSKKSARIIINNTDKPSLVQEIDKLAGNEKSYIIQRDGSLKEA